MDAIDPLRSQASRLTIVVIGCVFLLSVLACGGPSSTPLTQDARCELNSTLVGDLTDGLIEHIALGNVYVVKSAARDNLYFVSAGLEGAGLDRNSDIATWATDSLAGTGTISSVNELAVKHSVWPQNFSMSDDGAQESADCSRG